MTSRFEHDELIYEGRVSEVHSVGVRMPDGNVVDRDLILYTGAAVVLPVLDDGSIVMIRNYRFAVDQTLWELPAGMLEKDEDPSVCAARELTEETGYIAQSVRPLGMFYTTPGTSNEEMHAFLATGLTPGEQNLEGYEQITVEVIDQEAVKRMVFDGTIRDGKTIATLAWYWMGRGEGGPK